MHERMVLTLVPLPRRSVENSPRQSMAHTVGGASKPGSAAESLDEM